MGSFSLEKCKRVTLWWLLSKVFVHEGISSESNVCIFSDFSDHSTRLNELDKVEEHLTRFKT